MADVTSTLNSWSSTSTSNLPANSAAVGPNTLADNQRVIQAVVRAAVAGDGTIASATTTDLSTVNDGDITVTGTTTITGFGTLTAGVKKVLTFSGALILTHNATSLILPGAANITTAAGDVAVMRSLGLGNWKCIAFQPASGNAKAGANADITSMTALTAPTVAANPIRATDLQAQTVTAFTTGGTGTAFTLTPTPAITAYIAGQEWDVSFSAACGASPTLQISGIATPPNLVSQNADGTYSNLNANDFPSGWQSNVKMVSATQALVRRLPVNISQNSQSAAYTLVMGDANKHILHPSADTTARTFTIPANSSVPFPIGTAITFVNQNAAGVITISITTDTMRIAGSGTTGSRTLVANGIATALKITSTEWIISGTGLS